MFTKLCEGKILKFNYISTVFFSRIDLSQNGHAFGWNKKVALSRLQPLSQGLLTFSWSWTTFITFDRLRSTVTENCFFLMWSHILIFSRLVRFVPIFYLLWTTDGPWTTGLTSSSLSLSLSLKKDIISTNNLQYLFLKLCCQKYPVMRHFF